MGGTWVLDIGGDVGKAVVVVEDIETGVLGTDRVSRPTSPVSSRLVQLVPPDLRLPVTAIDALRTEIGEAIGGAGPHRRLTITFTTDPTQLQLAKDQHVAARSDR